MAVYDGTKTLANITKTKQCLLQLLTEELAPMVRVCGQNSGNDIDKISRLEKRYELKEHSGLSYVAAAAGFLELNVIDVHTIPGDHVLITGSVELHKNLNDAPILTTDFLRDHEYIR